MSCTERIIWRTSRMNRNHCPEWHFLVAERFGGRWRFYARNTRDGGWYGVAATRELIAKAKDEKRKRALAMRERIDGTGEPTGAGPHRVSPSAMKTTLLARRPCRGAIRPSAASVQPKTSLPHLLFSARRHRRQSRHIPRRLQHVAHQTDSGNGELHATDVNEGAGRGVAVEHQTSSNDAKPG